MSMHRKKPRLFSGDTPTGRLHLGHWVGTLESRVEMQDQYECYFVYANTHAFTTQPTQAEAIRQSTLDIVLDHLSVGIDPNKSTLFVESDVPAIFELTALFSMLIPFPRLMRNPTIKAEIRDKGLGDNYSFGFLLYPVMQVADILAFQTDIVPVGEDQIPHLELTREVARRFNQLYCGVDSHLSDEEQVAAGGLFPVPELKVGRIGRLVGIGPPGPDGKLLKMSKSFNNAILLSDSPDSVREKIMQMYTDPNRIRASDPGQIENNPLWIFHDTFNTDSAWVAQAKEKYQQGQIGDVECKKKLIDVLLAFLAPFQERRAHFAKDPHQVLQVLREGCRKANAIADDTLQAAKIAMKQTF